MIAQETELMRPGGGHSGGGGDDGGGPILPSMPEGEDLMAFLIFVRRLLEVWHQRVQAGKGEFDDVTEVDQRQLSVGWVDFLGHWNATYEELIQAVRELEPDDLRRRGLAGPAYEMKRHFASNQLTWLKAKYELLSGKLSIRKAWCKLFTVVDIVLDSVTAALTLAPKAAAITSGLKEFKEVAMGVSDIEE